MSSQDREEIYQDKLYELPTIEEKSKFNNKIKETDKNNQREFLWKKSIIRKKK